MNLQKLLSMRTGQRVSIENQLDLLEEAKSDGQLDDFLIILESVEDLAASLKTLDDKIIHQSELNNIPDEMQQSNIYNLQLKLKIRRHRQFYKDTKTTQPSTSSIGGPENTNQSSQQTASVESEESSADDTSSTHFTPVSLPSTSTYNVEPPQARVSLQTSHYHKLPKLTLPTFNGDQLMWQTFWDTYETTVHNNPHLSDIEKFNYLKSQLEGEAARTIDGFSLTNANYIQAVTLLRERYGKVHKIISAYMQALLQLPSPSCYLQDLKMFYDRLETNIRGLASLGESQDNYGNLLIPVILDKLPAETRQHLARDHGSDGWTLPELLRAISREIEILDAGQPRDKHVQFYEPTASFYTGATKKNNNVKESVKQTVNFEKRNCVFCNTSHTGNCEKVQDVKGRLAIVKSKRLCFNCLSDRHSVANCTSRGRCRQCNGKHHTSICDRSVERDRHTFHNNIHVNDTTILHTSSRPDILLKTAVAPVCSDSVCLDTNILMDEGAQRSFITRKLADVLQLKNEESEAIHLSAFGNYTFQPQRLDSATVYVVADDGEKIPIKVLIVPMIAKPINNRFRQSTATLKYLKGLKLAHPVTMETMFDIDLLIGADYYWDIVGDGVIRGNGPTAVSSRIGYFLSGPLPVCNSQAQSTVTDVIATHVAESTDLTQFWEIESLGISANENENEVDKHLQEYQSTSVSFTKGQYVARLPWKQTHPPLPTNYSIAKKRTESTIKRMETEPQLLQKYNAIIQDQESRGFIEKVPDGSLATRIHYIPHHGVKKQSATTPIRIVYDCSCRQSSFSPSLNDCLQSTPPELNDIVSVLMRFRLGKFAVSTDIEKAFLHVGLHEDDRDVTRFFWLSDPANPKSSLTTYRFKVVLFGATCSPFILNAVIQKHLDLHSTDPAAHVIARDLYVDNIISSFTSEKQLMCFFRSARDLMGAAGFNLRSWSSNSDKLRKTAENMLVHDNDTIVRTLGMNWEPEVDQLSFIHRQICAVPETTKRTILQQTSRVYDPLGMLTPVTVRAKIIIQDLWKKKLDWDTPLPPEVRDQWMNIAQDLNIAMTCTFPRQYFPEQQIADPALNTTLHVFVDASMKSYGAVAYLCFDKTSTFVIAKNRVAPVKELTLPRLELMAALLGARLANTVRKTISTKEVVYWSDSQIVLHWLKSKKLLKKFVSSRITEIHQLSSDGTWRYCNTRENPADLLTRGITADQLKNSTLWEKGPNWICNNKMWPAWVPAETQTLVSLIETENDQPTNAGIKPEKRLHVIIDVGRYSHYCKLIRVTAYVLRFLSNCRWTSRDQRRFGLLTIAELRHAEREWLRSCQATHYQEVINNIQEKGIQLPIVKQLRLFLDDNGYLRCGGRIHNAKLPEVTRFPYLLPAKHAVTRLLVLEAHRYQLHAGVNQTVTHIRQQFWIPSIRQCVRSVLRSCVTCRKVCGKPFRAPVSPPLPAARVNEEPPFSVTGVDYSGSLLVKEKSGGTSKVYICLFTCASTRAVHLEIVPDLTEESFLLAFRRFVSRRSLPKLMMSDNATTYHAAANHLQRIFTSQSVQTTLTQRGTQWHFIPTRAPWYGGWWERMIGVTKTTLKKVLGRACVNMQTLQTVITEVEAIINDRPLTYISSSVADPEPLTPSHLLHGRRLTTLPFDDHDIRINGIRFYDNHDDVNQRAQRHAQIIQHFQRRWKHEYLTALREYRSQGTNKQTIQVGDVVQIQDDFKTRLSWNLALVEELIVGNDNQTRAARIRTYNGSTTIPIVKLYPLEIIHNRHCL